MTSLDDGVPAARLVPYGPVALAALREALTAARGTAVLDPVTVVAPSALAGVTLRRALARPGLAGVRFCSLPQLRRDLAGLAGEVAAERSRTLRQARLRTALARRSSTWPSPASTPSGLDALDALLQELQEQRLAAPALAALDAAGGRPAAVAELFRALDEGPDTRVLAGAARTLVPVVLHLPRRVSPADLELCAALRTRGLLHAVLGLTGEDQIDQPVEELSSRLGLPVLRTGGAPTVAGVRLLPDAEEEVRAAVRTVLAHLDGEERPADRVALTYRASAPYARLLHEQLHAAGVPHHVPRQRTLAQGLTGHTLLGLLALPQQDWSRQAVLAWLADTPVRLATGALPQVARLDRLACEAGVGRGHTWARLDDLLAHLPAADERDDELQRTRTDLEALSVTVAALRADVALLESATTWTDFADLCRAVLRRWLRDPAGWKHADIETGRAVGAEQRAHEESLSAVAALSGLDALDEPPALGSLADRAQAVASQLVGALRESHGLGRGVLVAPLSDLVGADLDLAVVLGAVESSYPPRLREDPLLRDDVRASVGLRTTADRRLDERRDHLAVLAGAAEVLLSAPVADARAQRPLQPSPWVLEHDAAADRPVSFEASLRQAEVPATGQEHRLRSLLAGDPVGLDADLRRGLAAVDARRRGVFGPWLGGLTSAEDEGVAARLARGRSASALQEYAVCPFRWFLGRALRVRDRDEPEEDDVSPLNRGLLVHAVLEELVGATLGRDPDLAWTKDEHALAAGLLERRAQELVAQGKAGRPAVWEVRVAQMRRVLRRLLLSDDAYRQARRAVPRAVEMRFGLEEGGQGPVELELPSGRQVSLRGSVDRVDVTDSDVVVVLDYKTGKSEGYGEFPQEDAPGSADLTDRGRRLQLPLYAVAARRELGEPDSKVEAYYSFVDEGGTRRGGVVGPAEHDRLLDVLDTVTQGMADGVAPARPGAYNAFYRSFDNCGFCAYDRTCSAGRDEQWEAVRNHPRVGPYAQLAEGDT